MEMFQGNQCRATLNEQKCYFFPKNGEQKGRTGPVWRVGTSGRGEDAGTGCRGVTMVQILCTHVCRWKNETC
jgi:hypothetical protein